MSEATPQAVFFFSIWPEPQSSAAGVRSRELILFLQKVGYEVVGVSPAPLSRQAFGITAFQCDPNQSEATEKTLKDLNPKVVFFDRFFIEEQFGWRTREIWPQALQIIDTQDLHCLRRAREKACNENFDWKQILAPAEKYFGDDILREMASLHRVDACLVVSDLEAVWLRERGLEADRILYLPFSAKKEPSTPSLDARKDYCFLGNYLHAPNLDAVRWLTSELWPLLRKSLPDAKLYLYGAYATPEILQHKGKNGIYAHGSVENHRAALSQYEIMLAPLRFGAGIKGKVLEAWASGTPVIGTPITFESLSNEVLAFRTPEEFVAEALRLRNPDAWQIEVEKGKQILENYFREEDLFKKFRDYLNYAFANQNKFRSSLTGRMLRQTHSQYLKYFSKWIEEKNLKQESSTSLTK